MSFEARSNGPNQGEEMVQAAFRNATPQIIQLILAEIEKINVHGVGKADEAYMESLNELKDSMGQIRDSTFSQYMARL